MPVHGNGGKRLLLGQDIVDCVADLCQFGRAERRFPPDRRKASREQQRVVLAQGNIERCRQPNDHLTARRRTSQLQEAQVTL